MVWEKIMTLKQNFKDGLQFIEESDFRKECDFK